MTSSGGAQRLAILRTYLYTAYPYDTAGPRSAAALGADGTVIRTFFHLALSPSGLRSLGETVNGVGDMAHGNMGRERG